MEETVAKLCTNHENLENGLKILNIGFGLGMVGDVTFADDESNHSPKLLD